MLKSIVAGLEPISSENPRLYENAYVRLAFWVFARTQVATLHCVTFGLEVAPYNIGSGNLFGGTGGLYTRTGSNPHLLSKPREF